MTFVARIGNDLFGNPSIEGFRRDDIDIAHVETDKQVPSGIALILVDENGENSIAVASGANAEVTPSAMLPMHCWQKV